MKHVIYRCYFYIKKITVILILSALFISSVGYNINDASFNTVSYEPGRNFFGVFGSYTADLLVQFLGVGSFVLLISIIIYVVQSLFIERKYISSLLYIIDSITLAFCVSVISSKFSVSLFEKYNYGGILGRYFTDFQNYFIFTMAFISIIGLVGWKRVGYSLYKSISFLFSRICKVFIKNNSSNKSGDCLNTEKLEKKKLSILKKVKEPIEKNVVECVGDKQAMSSISSFIFPSISLLTKSQEIKKKRDEEEESTLLLLEEVLKDFGVQGEIVNICYGPVVTLYELKPSAGTKSSRVIGLADDIARSMSALSARISVIPGRNVIGIELPNKNREMVMLRDLIETKEYKDSNLELPIALGKDISGKVVIADLVKMPHLLVAGTTGSGKSVAINTMILSLIYSLSPDKCKMIMIDPKVLELSIYDSIPHLLTPVVTEPKKAVAALKWVVREMENRYRLMSMLGVRNITGYNRKVTEAINKNEKLEKVLQVGFDKNTGKPVFEKIAVNAESFPYIVVVVDEMADLMLVAGKDIESSIQRLAQMARAAGIHIIMATQRPSVDVITGVIKANFPTRISFAVTSKIDSRTILGEQGAEQLLGMGDMLYMVSGSRIIRVHGSFVSDSEVQDIVNYLKSQGSPCYMEDITSEVEDNGTTNCRGSDSDTDDLYDQAVEIVLRDRKASVSYVQRHLRIGYNRAANLIEQMEKDGILSSPGASGKREILAE